LKTKQPIRLLVADDHPTFRMGLVGLIENQPDMKVVAEAGDGHTALELFRQKVPDVVLMDLRMPGQGGVETILALLKEFPEARVVVVTTYDSDEEVFRAIQAGAKSYLLKDMAREQIVTTIREVHAGTFKLPASVASRLEERLRRPELTEREIEVLKLLVRGRSNKEIGVDLGISEATARFHLKAVFQKLEVLDRTQAVIEAVRRGLVQIG
jgi:two-component system NarL family response regulator